MVDCECFALCLARRIVLTSRYSQCEAMMAHYETCILLIEFDEDRFGLRVSFRYCHSKR